MSFADLPSFCRVTATISPVPGSSIRIELWLPTKTWNGRYQQSDNHGFTGTLYWSEMVRQLRRGYATGVTDDGHTAGVSGFDVDWAFGYPQRIVDLAYRAVHQLAVKAELVIGSYYGRSQKYAYFNGCSDGGREGMKEAQMFPDDFDGIIAGGAAQYWTHAATEQLVMSIDLRNAGIQGAPGAAILTLAQNAATATCDARDGVVDGLIGNPQKCHWDPATLVCKAGQDPATCITAAQALALKENIEPVRDPQTGRYVFSGMSRGSEFDEIRFGYQGLAPFGIGHYRIALNAPNRDGSTFDLHTDLPILDRVLGSVDATDTDLRPFRKTGAKLIQWHGWDDAAFTLGNTVRYYNEVVDATGGGKLGKVQDFYRLFKLPGVGHCGSGPGPDNIGAENQTAYSQDPKHDIVSALEAWVERGDAPDESIATKYVNDDSTQGVMMQRPICAYPNEAIYKGRGDTNQAKNFTCGTPTPARDDASSAPRPASDARSRRIRVSLGPSGPSPLWRGFFSSVVQIDRRRESGARTRAGRRIRDLILIQLA